MIPDDRDALDLRRPGAVAADIVRCHARFLIALFHPQRMSSETTDLRPTRTDRWTATAEQAGPDCRLDLTAGWT